MDETIKLNYYYRKTRWNCDDTEEKEEEEGGGGMGNKWAEDYHRYHIAGRRYEDTKRAKSLFFAGSYKAWF